jgi:hypothetical protein
MLNCHQMVALNDLMRKGRVLEEYMTSQVNSGSHGAFRTHRHTIYRLSLIEFWKRKMINLSKHAEDARKFYEEAKAFEANRAAIESRSIVGEPQWQWTTGPDGRQGWHAPRGWRDRMAKRTADRKFHHQHPKHPATPDGTVGSDMSSD